MFSLPLNWFFLSPIYLRLPPSVPFCAHRCGYCDFVTVTGREHRHAAYVDALLVELEQERHRLAAPLDTIFLGGGTPTLLAPSSSGDCSPGSPTLPRTTVEANPETVTDELATALPRAA